MPSNVYEAGRASSPGKQTVVGSILKPGTFVRWRFGHEKKFYDHSLPSADSKRAVVSY